MIMYASELEERFREKAQSIKVELAQINSAIIILDGTQMRKPLKFLEIQKKRLLHEQKVYGAAIVAIKTFRAKWKGYKSWEHASLKEFELNRIKEDLCVGLCQEPWKYELESWKPEC